MSHTKTRPRSIDDQSDLYVTDAGAECLALRCLMREAIQVLRAPSSISDTDRHLLADKIEDAVTPIMVDALDSGKNRQDRQ